MTDKLTTDLLNKRVLLGRRYKTMNPLEFIVKEFSPDGKYVKLRGQAGAHASDAWFTSNEWTVVSVLPYNEETKKHDSYGLPYKDPTEALEDFLRRADDSYSTCNASRNTWVYADGTPMPEHLTPKEIQ